MCVVCVLEEIAVSLSLIFRMVELTLTQKLVFVILLVWFESSSSGCLTMLFNFSLPCKIGLGMTARVDRPDVTWSQQMRKYLAEMGTDRDSGFYTTSRPGGSGNTSINIKCSSFIQFSSAKSNVFWWCFNFNFLKKFGSFFKFWLFYINKRFSSNS